MNKKELIEQIVALEWDMMQNVKDARGRMSCQDDSRTFRIMRSSQAVSWSEEALASYLQDLREAGENGRNLLTEKYARMMKYTSPTEYESIESLLPPLPEPVVTLIEKIVPLVMTWEEDLASRYPNIHKRGRPLYSSEDTAYNTSVETYMRGELATYSAQTLELYLRHILRQKEEYVNGAEIVLLHMVKNYGYASLAEADSRMR